MGIFILAAIGALFYLSTHIGIFRFDKVRYNSYIIYCNDISGLAKKSDVKIAGVKVGWIDSIDLACESSFQVKAQVMILKDYKLKVDAYAVVRQEGMLGHKYLEIVPGTHLAVNLKPGSELSKPTQEPVLIEDVVYQVKEIALNINEVSKSLKEVFGGSEGVTLLKASVQNFSSAAQKISEFSNSLDKILTSNEQNISGIVSEIKLLVKDLKEQLPQTIQNIDRQVSQATNQISNGFKNFSEVSQKINSGQGLIGKLINEEETYRDLKSTISTVKAYADKMSKLAVISDIHSETMSGLAEKFPFRDNKGIFNLRIHPNEDYFYIAGITTSQKGYLHRTEATSEYFDELGNPILPSIENQRPQTATIMVSTTKTKVETLDDFRFNLQFGKMFTDMALRIGLFEGFAGLAADYEVPMGFDNLRWVTTLEAYDFRGRNHYFHDPRPHFKWLNRMFIGRNIYITFGADDFISKWNKNVFFGAGIRFSDDDLKYFMPAGVSIIG